MSVEEVCNKLNEDEFNISILGGEPLMQYEEILALCKMIKTRYPYKTIWMWSGYGLSLIRERYTEILRYIDTLVDGPFIKALASSELLWRGSSNQRVIDKAQFFSEANC